MFVKSYVIKYGETPLFFAAREGHINVVKYLVREAKANPSQKNQVLSVIKHTCCCDVCFLEWHETTRAFVS